MLFCVKFITNILYYFFSFYQESYDRAKSILKQHQSELTSLANALMKYETLNKDEIKSVIEGKQLKKWDHPAYTSFIKEKEIDNLKSLVFTFNMYASC